MENSMVNNCANPSCGKPLHYLREGRIFVFDMPDPKSPKGTKSGRLEHFWLCGTCSETLLLEQNSGSIRLVPKRTIGPKRVVPVPDEAEAEALAS